MTTEPTPQPNPETLPPDGTVIQAAYAGPSVVETAAGKTQVALFGNLKRPEVKLTAKLKDPLRFREALSALYAIVGSDYRYVPKDRTAYVAYLRMKREAAGLGLWQAQQAYFGWLMRNDPLAYLILDPIITVHPDRLLFEVFSKDEGTYALLSLDHNAFQPEGAVVCGTTNIDFSQALFDGVQQIRSYRSTTLMIGQPQVQLATPGVGEVLEKQIRVPDSWLRGFLQVQSAATLPLESFSLAAIDLYNLLRHLRMHGDRKGQRRGLRIELVPAEAPRLVLEPWEAVLPCSAGIYKGKTARVVRVWGRRRLMLLRRLLPYVHTVDVHLLGTGLPSFWVLRGEQMTLTLGLTGFTAANWSQAVTFDLLLPRKTQTTEPLQKVLNHLGQVWLADYKALGQATGLKGPALLEAVQLGCQQGKLIYDLANGVYRLRPLTETPLDLSKLEYRNQREKTAHDLCARRDAVEIASVNRIPGTGLELTGKVSVEEDRRDYRPQLLLGDEGQVLKAECTCSLFRKQGLKAGPCAHLIALRLAHAEQEKRKLEGADPRQTVTIETRTYTRRDESGEEVLQLSLDRQRVKVRFGRTGQAQRLQTLRFNSVEEARTAYFSRIDQLDARGYMDATAG